MMSYSNAQEIMLRSNSHQASDASIGIAVVDRMAVMELAKAGEAEEGPCVSVV